MVKWTKLNDFFIPFLEIITIYVSVMCITFLILMIVFEEVWIALGLLIGTFLILLFVLVIIPIMAKREKQKEFKEES